jgi:hypothetical protein
LNDLEGIADCAAQVDIAAFDGDMKASGAVIGKKGLKFHQIPFQKVQAACRYNREKPQGFSSPPRVVTETMADRNVCPTTRSGR